MCLLLLEVVILVDQVSWGAPRAFAPHSGLFEPIIKTIVIGLLESLLLGSQRNKEEREVQQFSQTLLLIWA